MIDRRSDSAQNEVIEEWLDGINGQSSEALSRNISSHFAQRVNSQQCHVVRKVTYSATNPNTSTMCDIQQFHLDQVSLATTVVQSKGFGSMQ